MKDFRHYAKILNCAIEGRQWLIGDRLSYADFRVAFVLPVAETAGFPWPSTRSFRAGMINCTSWTIGAIGLRGLRDYSASSQPSG